MHKSRRLAPSVIDNDDINDDVLLLATAATTFDVAVTRRKREELLGHQSESCHLRMGMLGGTETMIMNARIFSYLGALTSIATAVVVFSLTACAQAASVFSDDFETYAVGDLTGQGGWFAFSGVGASGSLDVGGGGNPGQSAFSDFSLSGGSTGNSHPITPLAGGQFSTTVHVLPKSFAELRLRDPAGSYVITIEMSAANTWQPGAGGYRVQSSGGALPGGTLGALDNVDIIDVDSWHELKITLDTVSHTADFVYTNLGTSAIVKQFLGVPYNPSAVFSEVSIYSWGQGRFDNLNVVMVPEPSSIALFGLGLIAVIHRVRR